MTLASRLAAALAILLVSAGSPAQAEPTAAQKETAHALVVQGRKKLEAKDYAGAIQALQAAHDIMKVPTTALDLAIAWAATGKLVEARSVAREVARMPERADEPQAFKDARPTALKLASDLEQRIPSIVVNVTGLAQGITPSVSLDGGAVQASLLALPLKVNPGVHTVAVQAVGYVAVEKTVTVAEGKTQPVDIALVPAPSTATAAKAPAAAPPLPKAADAVPPPAAPPEAADPPAEKAQVGGVPTWAWIAGGVGVAAGAGAAVFALDYKSVQDTISHDCPTADASGALKCDANKYPTDVEVSDVQSHRDRSGGLAFGLGSLGVAALGAAVVGIVTAPPSHPSSSGAGWVLVPAVQGNAAGNLTLLGTF